MIGLSAKAQQEYEMSMANARTLLMLAFPQAQLLDVAGPLQMFAGANDALGHCAYRLQIAAPDVGPFATSSGVQLVADVAFKQVSQGKLARTHTLIAVGGNEGVRTQLEQQTITRIIATAVGRVQRIASVCTGAFFLAAAGILDGRRATTHWNSIAALKSFRPAVQVDGDAIHIEDRGVWTSAGVTAGMDLALAMIEADHGRAIALSVARRHVVFRIRPGGQSQFSAELAAQSATDPKVQRLAEKVTTSPAKTWRTEELAFEAGVSERSLSRLFRGSLNVSPADFVERVRIDLARRWLLETGDSIERVALKSGFGSLRRLDRAFARAVGTSPTEFRARFKSSGGPNVSF
jgi:transcriptional regulator GlxA family with amidase domain